MKYCKNHTMFRFVHFSTVGLVVRIEIIVMKSDLKKIKKISAGTLFPADEQYSFYTSQLECMGFFSREGVPPAPLLAGFVRIYGKSYDDFRIYLDYAATMKKQRRRNGIKA
ncbi:hypothetical protein [Limisalsivibrio acetivorans]|uniref:hypothetical protein n=1 Tax=Limisalsivibrio acetivorans TaxID=1304888 RepID=UPI0003B5E57A|nr:hypothetical protein [Limisalsivibrio acetivorans]